MQGEGYCECGCGELAPLAQRTQRSRGLVKGQPQRFVLGHSAFKRGPEYEARDCGHTTPCWIWLRSVRPNGYGQAGDRTNAHRMIYERSNGTVTPGLELDHLCRVPACVNPDHLEPVTHAENMQRGANARLTVEQVRAIRASSEPGTVLARRYGVAFSTVYAVINGKSWKGIA